MSPVLKAVCLLCFLLFLKTTVFGNTIIVTTNSDSGPGSLRDAITQCAANGTATQDSVIFAIVDNSQAGRTITLLSPLPALTSNMVINGISQNGAPIGVSNAEIMLFLPVYNSNFTFLQISDCSNVGVYGLAFVCNYVYTGTQNYHVYGISYVRCHNLQIGRPGAGNYLLGCSYSIFSNTGRYGAYVPADSSRALTIQSNIVGLDMNGGFSNSYQGQQVPMMWESCVILNTADILMGGDDPAEGNTIVFGFNYPGYSFTGYNIDIESEMNLNNGIMTIKNNKFGTRTDGTLDPNFTSVPVSIYILGNQSDYDLHFTDNILQGELNITYIGKYFYVQGNTIYSPRINTVYDCGITLAGDNGGGLIGGLLPGQSNSIYNNYTDTLYYFNAFAPWVASIRFDLQSHATLLNNITTCNKYYNSSYLDDENNGYLLANAFVRIDSTGVNYVKGKATPNTRIDVYLDDDCPACEGKSYLGFTMSNADSSWSYTGVFNSTVVATSTAGNGQTSMFSAPTITDYYVKIKQPGCGMHNGYIKGLQVAGGDHYKWHYMYQVNGHWRDSIVATTIDLMNAGPGLYFFDAWLGQTCRSYYLRYQLSDQTPKLDTSAITINNPGCGKFNGSITNLSLSTTQDIKISWINANRVVVGNQTDLINAGPGKYKLIIMDTISNCGDSSFFYSLINQSGPSPNINNVQITNANCRSATGSITGIQFSNIMGTPVYLWYDSLNRIVGNSADLIQVVGGNYYMKFKDQGACDTITTPVFSVGSIGLIQLNTSSKIITDTKCSAANGGIANISISNADSYTWIDAVTRNIVSQNKDLINVQSGYYKLIVNNSFGCSDSTASFLVPQGAARPMINMGSAIVSPDACMLTNGSITGMAVQGSSPFDYEWLNGSGQLVGKSNDLTNMPEGTYYLEVTDKNGCSDTSGLFQIRDTLFTLAPPVYQDQFVAKGTPAKLQISDPPAGTYQLFATINIPSPDQENTTGSFTTTQLFEDTTVYVLYKKGTCSSPLSPVHITVVVALTITMPNAFSPNGDGHNDLFRLKYPSLVQSYQITIFNRWGQKIFETKDAAKGWDGTLNGMDQPEGNYVYLIRYTNLLGEAKSLSGSVILIR